MSAYGGTPWPVPGVIQAENYDVGGEAITYHDTTVTNEGGQYRPNEAPDVADFGYWDDLTHSLGWFNDGEWFDYTVNVATAGNYNLGARISSIGTSGTIRVDVDGVDVTGPMSVPRTGSYYEKFATVERQGIPLDAGVHTLRVNIGGSGFTLNYLQLAPESSPVLTPPPTAPADLSVTAATTSQVDLQWSDTSDNELGFRIERSTDGVNFKWAGMSGANVTRYTVTGLDSSTEYQFRVVARNRGGDSALSNTAIATTPTPAAISEDFAAGASNFTAIDGQWAVSSGAYVVTADNNVATTHLNSRSIHRAFIAGDFTLEVDARALDAAYPWANFSVIFGYQNAQNYYFFSSNQSNDAATSGIFKVVNGVSTELADVPAGITPGTTYRLRVERQGSQIRAYRAGTLVATAADSTFTSGQVGLGARQFQASFDNLTVTGTVTTPPPQPAPTAPAAPSALTASAASASQINLSWADNSGDETGFKVERSADGTTWAQVATVGANVRAYAATGLSASTAYQFRVRAYNVAGNSTYSNAASATTQAGPAVGAKPGPDNTGPTGTLVASGSITTTRDGQVIEGVNVTGKITVAHNNVTIRNFRLDGNGGDYPINYSGKTGLVVEDGEIIDFDTAAVGPDFTDYTIRRCELHESGGDALKAEGNVTVEYNYIHHLGTSPGAHADGVQSSKGSGLTVRFNNIDVPINLGGYESNAAVFLAQDFGPISNVLIEGNWLNGGNYTLFLDSSSTVVRDNLFGRGYRYGPISTYGGGYTVTNNRWEDTLAPI